MAILKKLKWTEDDLEALPAGEQDYFERKSGRLLDKDRWEEGEAKLAKAVCAFANTGGGHLIVGVADDGSIDGIDNPYRGRESAKDWFEKLVPRLVEYPLQDYRVHEVVPSTTSRIPAGKVVIVVDVGDSPSAPHQTKKTKTYYYRNGSKSEPAPHFHLDMLWGRQKFPSSNVARAWIDTVIRPLITTLKRLRRYLQKEQREWGYEDRRDTNIPQLLSSTLGDNPNLDQFLESYPDVGVLTEDYDKHSIMLNGSLSTIWQGLLHSEDFKSAYEKTMSEESRELVLKEARLGGKRISNTSEFCTHMFGDDVAAHHLQILAAMIVNNTGELTTNQYIAPFWNAHREMFIGFLKSPPFRQYFERAEQARADLLNTVEVLTEVLQARLRELATRHSEPYMSAK